MCANARYLTFVLDLATSYFLELHDIRFEPKNIQDLNVEQRSSGSLAQYESLYAHKENLQEEGAGDSRKKHG